MLIHLVADYGAGDLAFAEVTQRLVGLIDDAAVVPVPVPAFDTVSAGFCAAQLALGGQGRGTGLVYVNVAPRADQPDPRPGNQGERLVAAFCDNGLPVVSVNAGYCLSFLAPRARFYQPDVPDSGSQFRSRDIFPAVVAALASGRSDEAGPELPAELVPPPPAEAVCYVDGYGNLKTTYTSAPVPAGAQVEVTVGGAVTVARVADGTFEVPQGEMSFAPGSSGWAVRGVEQRFYELLVRGGSAAQRFGYPRAGAPVQVCPA